MKKKVVPSEQTQQESMKIAKATQKPGQTKEQTRLVAQGIEKGIALYKKQQKEKNRQTSKAKKKVQKAKLNEPVVEDLDIAPEQVSSVAKLPWLLLIVSWGMFAAYLIWSR